jgi:xylose isomerase
MIEDGGLEEALTERYAGWKTERAIAMLDSDLGTICDWVVEEDINPTPRSGQQEILENYVNKFV